MHILMFLPKRAVAGATRTGFLVFQLGSRTCSCPAVVAQNFHFTTGEVGEVADNFGIFGVRAGVAYSRCRVYLSSRMTKDSLILRYHSHNRFFLHIGHGVEPM